MRSLIATLIFTLLAGCATRSSIPDDPSERLTSGTVLYIEVNASVHRFAVESSRLALEKSQNPAVRDYAAAMIDAHTRMTNQLETASGTVRPAAPAFALISHHFAMLERLRQAGADFDPLYRDFQVAVHKEAVALDEEYAADGNVLNLAALARDDLTTARTHLQQAQQLPVPPTPVLVPPPPPIPPAPAVGRPGERG